jgi:Endosomal/lysosomal potassium channel TMEM175
VSEDSPKTERLNSFSDGIFAVVITIIALDLRPPHAPSLDALLELWPTVVSYVASLSLHRHRLGEPSSSSTLYPRSLQGTRCILFQKIQRHRKQHDILHEERNVARHRWKSSR